MKLIDNVVWINRNNIHEILGSDKALTEAVSIMLHHYALKTKTFNAVISFMRLNRPCKRLATVTHWSIPEIMAAMKLSTKSKHKSLVKENFDYITSHLHSYNRLIFRKET